MEDRRKLAWIEGEKLMVDASRIISLDAIGMFDGNPAIRLMPYEICSLGWAWWFKHYIDPKIEAGCCRFALHNPGGWGPNRTMDFNQWTEMVAIAGPRHPAHREFVATVKRYSKYPGREFIWYTGCPIPKLTYSGFIKYADAHLQAALDAGMSVALDAVVLQNDSGQIARYCDRLESKGVKIYVNSLANTGGPRWADFPTIADPENYQRSKMDGWGLPNYPKEIALICQNAGRARVDGLPYLQQGLSIYVQMNPEILEQGLTLEKIFG